MIVPTLKQVTAAFAIGGACYCLFKHRSNPSGRSLEAVVGKLLAASSIPTGAVLLLCAFDTSLRVIVSDAGLYVAAAGFVLLLVSIKELLK